MSSIATRLARRALINGAIIARRPANVREDMARVVVRLCREPERALRLVGELFGKPAFPLTEGDHVMRELDRLRPASGLSHEAFVAHLETLLGGKPIGPVAGGKPLCADTQLILEGSSSGR